MDFSAPPDYLAQAEKCMEWAERANDRETELHWLSMAQAYFALAEALVKEDPQDVWGGHLPPGFDHNAMTTRH
jgi:hypothetical protein